MEQLNNLDVVFLIIVGVSALVGIARGMTKEILSILGWVLAAVATFYLTPMVNPIAKEHISSEILATLVSGMAILIVFCIVWILIVDKIAAVIRQSKLSVLDRLFGFVFGAARGVLIVVLVALMVSTLVPDASKEGVFAKSQIFKEATLYVEPLKEMIPQEWVDTIKTKTDALGLGTLTDMAKKENAKDQPSEAEPEDNTTKDQPAKTEGTDKPQDAATQGGATDDKNAKEPNALEDNLDVLQKTGEEIFEKLAQPRPAGETETEAAPEESDLDKLLDVLEDKIVSTEDGNNLVDASNKVANMVVDTIAESVADKVNTKNAATAKAAK